MFFSTNLIKKSYPSQPKASRKSTPLKGTAMPVDTAPMERLEEKQDLEIKISDLVYRLSLQPGGLQASIRTERALDRMRSFLQQHGGNEGKFKGNERRTYQKLKDEFDRVGKNVVLTAKEYGMMSDELDSLKLQLAEFLFQNDAVPS